MSKLATELNVLVFPDNDIYVAQCLEYDIAVQGKDIEEVQERFLQTIGAFIKLYLDKGEVPFTNFPKTPKSFERMLKRSTDFKKIHIPAPRRKINGKTVRSVVPQKANLVLTHSPSV